jgi:hypothetical protein
VLQDNFYELFNWSPRPQCQFNFNIQFNIILLIGYLSFKQIFPFRWFATELYDLRKSSVHVTCYKNVAILGVLTLIMFGECINDEFISTSIYSPHSKITSLMFYMNFMLYIYYCITNNWYQVFIHVWRNNITRNKNTLNFLNELEQKLRKHILVQLCPRIHWFSIRGLPWPGNKLEN